MTSPNLSPTQASAADALFDQIERALVALGTATLDDDDAPPAQCVDEFSTEFLMQWSMPPG
jgi:hypothetical protein